MSLGGFRAAAAGGLQRRTPEYVNYGVAWTTANSVTHTLPTGWAQYDIFVAHILCGNGLRPSPELGFPVGWTKIGQVDQVGATSGQVGHVLAWRRAGASESGASWDVTKISTTTSNGTGLVVHGYRHCVRTGNPVHKSAFAGGSSSTSQSVPSLTTTEAHCLLTGFTFTDENRSWTWTSWAEKFDDSQPGSPTNSGTAATRVAESPGVYSDGAWTMSSTNLTANAAVALLGR